jgi:hypothetical protein
MLPRCASLERIAREFCLGESDRANPTTRADLRGRANQMARANQSSRASAVNFSGEANSNGPIEWVGCTRQIWNPYLPFSPCCPYSHSESETVATVATAVAVVTDRRWVGWALKIGAWMVRGEVRAFSPTNAARPTVGLRRRLREFVRPRARPARPSDQTANLAFCPSQSLREPTWIPSASRR